MGQFLQLPEKESEYMRLTRLSDIKEKYYLLLKENRLSMRSRLQVWCLTHAVLDSATETVQVAPKVLQVWGIAIMAGLLLSFAFVYYQYLSNDTIFGVPDILRKTDISIAGVLPFHDDMQPGAPSVVVTNRATSIISESFRGLRTAVLHNISHDFLQPPRVGSLL